MRFVSIARFGCGKGLHFGGNPYVILQARNCPTARRPAMPVTGGTAPVALRCAGAECLRRESGLV